MNTVAIKTKFFYKGLFARKYKNLTIPNFVSYLTLFSTLSGIFLLLNRDFLLGALLFWTLCDVFDTLDGYIARKFNMLSPLGADLDSLIDVFAFLVPPFLISLQSENYFLMVTAIIFVAAGIYRLARFNVEKTTGGLVVGLQASLAAHLVYFSLLINISYNLLAFVYLLLSLLMVLPVKTKGKYSLSLTAVLMGLNFVILAEKLW